ncbi:MAG: M1 family aminopeptidase, partial [Acidobacteriota bacterium]|nr:M1 family aminopeptidase [Acidobacteriota bacterium]
AVDADEPSAEQRRGFDPQPDLPLVSAEPSWLFSNRAQWYPQAQVTDYATADLRITVPSEYTVVASGVQALGSPVVVGAQPNGEGGTARFSFTASQPVRYLSMVVSRMTRADAATVALDIIPPATSPPATSRIPTIRLGGNRLVAVRPATPPIGSRNTIELSVDGNRRQEGRGREALVTIAEILRLYASLIGDVPYDALNVAMVENTLPGGHAPGYVAVINNQLPNSPYTWRNDPAAFGNFPEFFLAHEVAHQWFGQAVGWKNYHEQWLSEGFAQYLAALYARERRGESAFRDLIKQFRRWSLQESSEGPIYLGYRLGHIKREGRVFRALVYNKGAAVLHMLRRFVGDDAFFKGVRRFYRDNRFRKAGTEDLQHAMETESGMDLARFFERWVYDSGIPRLRYATSIGAGEVTVRLEQSGDDIYDVPVTVTIEYADGSVDEQVVRITEAVAEARLPVTKAVRNVDLNQDYAALAQLDRAR